MKVSKLDFNYRDICIFNIVNHLMIRVASGPSICHQIHPLSAISTTGKKREKTCVNSKCTSIAGKIDLKK